MAHTSALKQEMKWGDKRVKAYYVTMASGQTSVVITPGAGYGSPVGAYDYYTVSGNTYTFTTQNPGGTKYCYILFFNPTGGA